MAKQRAEKIYDIAVVGMSGTESERGPTGVGKSCLCNRFMRPHADDYYTDHISVISSSDFSGRIVNNDHFVYWGEITKKSDGDPLTYRVVEQTEFIDDSSFSPLRGSNTHNYYKRAAVTSLKSAEKLMYICKDQVGDETNFEQRVLPEGKFPVDGFLVVYDVSRATGHDKQFEWLTKLVSQLNKAKRPVVVVATKWDEAVEPHITLVRNLASKNKAPLIETSAQEGVNVDLAFYTLACKIDKKGVPRETSYSAANDARKRVINRAVEEYENMLKQEVTDYHDLWTSKRRQYQDRDVFKRVVELMGSKNAKTIFTRHTKRLRTNYQQNKMQLYLGRLSDALESIFPDLNSISGRDWTECHRILPQMANFSDWFVSLQQPWRMDDYIDTDDLHIPYDVLKENERECESCFCDHVNRLNAAKRKEKMKEEFKKLLESLSNLVLPNRGMDDDMVQDALADQECYNELEEGTRAAIYNVHQENIQARALHDFSELLIERHDILASVDIRQDARKEVNKVVKRLENEPRYQKLSEMSQERLVMLIKQLAFVQNPTTESCYYADKCMEKLIQNCIENSVKNRSPVKDTLGSWDDHNNKLSLLIMGEEGLAEELASDIRRNGDIPTAQSGTSQSQSYDGDYTLDKVLYSLDIRAIEGSVTHSSQLISDRFSPQGLVCVCTSLEGFQYIKNSLEQTILSGRDEYNTLTFRHLPVVLMFGRSTSPEADTAQVREQAFMLCSRLNTGFIVNVPPENTTLWNNNKKFSESQIQDALRRVVENRKQGTPNQTESDRGMKGSFRIGLCMPCGDPFQPDLVLSPVTSHTCAPTPNGDDNCITCDMFLIDAKCRVEFEVASYHLADKLKDERLHHGYILVYAAQRKASLELLKWFLKLVAPIPTLVVAVCEDINSAAEGITEGNKLVDQIETASIITANCSSFRDQTVIYNRFLKSAYDKRKETEKYNNLVIDDQGPLTPVMSRPPLDLPSTPDHPTHDEVPTPTSGGEEYYDDIGMAGRRNSAKTTTENLYGVVDKSRKAPGATVSDPGTPDDEKPVVEDLYAAVDKPGRASTPKAPVDTSVPEDQNEATYGVVERKSDRKNPSENLGGRILLQTDESGMGLYAEVNRDTQSTQDGSGMVDNQMYDSYNNRPTGPMQGMVDNTLYDSYDNTKSPGPGQGMVDNTLYDSYDNTKSPRPGQGMVDNTLYDSYDNTKSPGPGRGMVDNTLYDSYDNTKSAGPGQGMVDNTLYDSYDNTKSPGPGQGMVDNSLYDSYDNTKPAGAMQGMVDNSLYASYDNTKSPGPVEDSSMTYASVDEMRGQDEGSEGLRDNPLYAPWTNPQASEPRTKPPPPTAPKPGFQKVTGRTTPMRAPPPQGYVPPPQLHHGGSQDNTYAEVQLQRPLLQEKQTPIKRPAPRVQAKDKEHFLDGLNKILKHSIEGSNETLTNTPTSTKKDKPKIRGKEKKVDKKKNKMNTPIKKPTRPPLDTLLLNENGIPPFIELCVKRIEDEGIQQEGIYRQPGKATDIEAIMKMFDENQIVDLDQIENLSSNTVASALKQFFNSLPEPIIPYSTQDRMISDYKADLGKEEEFVDKLPEYLTTLTPNKHKVLTFMMRHMKRISEYSERNFMTAENISICWWPSMLHPQSTSFDDLANEALLATVFRLIVERTEELFLNC